MEIFIKGKRYPLEMNLWAMEQIEETFGGIQGMYDAMSKGKKMLWSSIEVLRILVNAPIVREAVEMNTKPETITHSFLSVNLRGGDITSIKTIVAGSMAEGMHSRMKDPDLDDEEHDVVLEELAKKETAE